MKRLRIVRMLAGAALTALACKGDPTASLRGGAKFVDLSTTVMFIDVGTSKSVLVVIRDEQQNPLAADVTVTTVNTAVATVVPDTTVPSPNGTEHNFIVTAVAPGATKLVVQSAGLSDTVTVSVLPVNFAGTVSSATPKGGDTVVVTSTALLKFDSTASEVVFGSQTGTLLRRTRDSLVYLMPFGVTGGVTVTNIDVTYVPGLVVTLALATQPVTTGDRWAPGDTGYTTAPTLATPTVTGKSLQYLMQLPSVSNDADCAEGTGGGGVGKCTIFKYIANGTDSLQFTVNWTPATTASTDNSDIDIYSCNSTMVAGCFEEGGAGATTKTPESFTYKAAAGTHYLVIEQYSTGEDKNVYVTITKKN